MSAHPHPTSEESGSIWKIINVILAVVIAGFTLFWAVTLLIGSKAETSGWNDVEEVAEAAPAATTEAAAAPAAAAPVAGTDPAPAPAPAADAAPAVTAAGTTPAPAAAEITIKVDVANPLAYDLKEFSVKAGQAVKLTFNNVHPAVPQMHNLVIGVPGSKDKLLALAMQMATSPDGMAKGYVPESPDILYHTKLLQPNQSETLEFTAPAVGEYPYICTFPGHGVIMNGVMRVE
ncbi:plastocyanin/azurin family copper-binding protein [Prosthecobacter sp. SYSU 5D2]|uniref:plastocyanin/azurin family copper-binding protein n=1 Tax=Prosthecobacter sp. SYSU 5D2 TaxID=3134134 RepID=UPI0031FE678D